GSAVACIKHYGTSFDITLPKPIKASEIKTALGDALQEIYGSVYGRNTEVEGIVRYRAAVPLGIQAGLNSVPFHKPCGKTFQEAADENWNFGGHGGGMCGGSGGTYEHGIIGYSPIYRTATVTTPQGPSSQEVLVGNEPIYRQILTPSNDAIEMC